MQHFENKIVGVLLAAGQSTRFGQNKCLQKLANGNEIALQSALNLRQHVDQIICIIPENNTKLQDLFEKNGFETAQNPQATSGISSSIKRGVESSKYAHAWLICLADMPFILSQTYHTIISELGKEKSIVIPTYQGKRGNPVGFTKHFYESLTQLKGDTGAKQIFKQYESNIHLLNAEDKGIVKDIDTKSDLNESS